jgi:arylsulfatase
MGRALLPLAAAVLAVAGCAPERASAPLAGFHLVLVNVDTLRADHLGFQGYARPTSPALDALAARGVVFEEAMAASSVTRESVAALLTGRLPSRSGSFGWRAAPAPDAAHLGELLQGAGYRTAFLSNTVMLRDRGFARGFAEVQHLPQRWDLSGEGMRLTERALGFAREAGGAPFAMYLHYLDPHAPYDPAPELLAQLGATPSAAPLALYRDVEPALPALLASGFGPGEPRFDDLVARYDAEILSTDQAIGALVEGLASAGLLERTLVVVTADHGEEFLEHGWVEHGWTLHRESLHVPLLFFAPAVLAAARVAEPVSQLDVLPSLVALLGLEPPRSPLEGASLFALEAPAPRPRAREGPVVAELLLAERNVVRAVLWQGWKYVGAQQWIPPAERAAIGRAGNRRAVPRVDPWGPLVHEALYRVQDDPDEARDRLAAEGARAEGLRARLAASIGARRPLAEAPPAPRVESEEAERLRALGYH